MRSTRRGSYPSVRVLCIVSALVLTAVLAASCGGTSTKTKSSTTTKLPPGVTETGTGAESTTPTSSAASSTPDSSAADPGTSTTGSSDTTTATTPSVIVDLAGGRFTMVNATRPDSNKSVTSSSGREVKGDYLECEFTMLNIGDELVDLSEYSFRLQSPGIAADTYEDYYGTTGTYGAYVDDDTISASLLSYSDLQAVTYKVKEGETVDKVFVFFDLNPNSVARNAGVTRDNTTVIIKKTSGTDYGTSVTIPLTGYPD